MYETVYDEDLDVQNLGCTQFMYCYDFRTQFMYCYDFRTQFMYCYDFQSGSAQEGREVS